MKRLIAATALLGLAAQAAPVLSPQGIIVNPVPTDLQVRTWVNKDPSGSGNSVYFVGEKITLYVSVNQDAYVSLFNINADGKIDLILPNSFDGNNFMRGGETRQFPPTGARYTFDITGPYGLDQVLAVASRSPLSLSQIADIRSGQMRVQGASNLARALSIVVTPLPQTDWVTDVVRYRVDGAAAQPQPPVVVQPQPPVVVQPQPRPQPGFIIIAPLPGWTVIWEDRDDEEYSLAYRGGGGRAQDVFSYYERDLRAKGWSRVNYAQKGNPGRPHLWAEFRRGGERAELLVKTKRGEVEVSLKWDNR